MTTGESREGTRQTRPRPRGSAVVRPIEPSQMASVMRESMGPFAVDNGIRNAITACWRTLPEDQRSPDRVEAEVLRIVRRALDEFKADAAAFGF